jgi:hypothetical protein
VNREQLAHVLRAAARIASDPGVVVLGSQAVLGSRDADDLPEVTTFSMEADIAFWDDPDEKKMDQVDGAIGEGSDFHEMYGYYAQGVTIATAVLPKGWQDRTVPFARPDAEPSAAVCLEAHDLVVSKLVAGREKDLDFTTALIGAALVEPGTLVERAGMIDRPEAVRERVRAYIRRCVRAAETQTY